MVLELLEPSREYTLSDWDELLPADPGAPAAAAPVADGEKISEGGRNRALTREAGKIRRRGFSPAAVEAALKAGATEADAYVRTAATLNIEVREGEVCIPGGNYLMGCVPGDTECADNEKPLVMPTLSPFFVDVKETTFEEIIPLKRRRVPIRRQGPLEGATRRTLTAGSLLRSILY